MVGTTFEAREGAAMPAGASPSHARQEPDLKPDAFRFWTARAAPLSGSPFASISAGIGKPGLGATRIEPATGYNFPEEWCFLKKSPCPGLAGLGVRNKRIVVKDIHVYALGIYVDAAAARPALASFRKRPVEELAKDQGFYDAVLSTPAEKSLRLVISSRLVDRRKFVDALEERLAPRLQKAGEPEAMEAFRKQFDGIHFEKGLEIAFTCLGNKQLVTQVSGQQKGSISSAALCSSLFDIYLGADPVSREAKASFGRSVAEAVAAGK